MNGSRPLVVAVDLDGVIAEFNEWKGEDHFGEPIAGARETLAELRKRGIKIVIYTCRSNIDKVREYLDRNGIPYDFINDNPYSPADIHPCKLYADIYVDDRAIGFTCWSKTMEQIELRLGQSKPNRCQAKSCRCKCRGDLNG